MATSTTIGLALVLVGNAVLALRRTGRGREVIALGVSALAGLVLGVGYGMPHGDEGLRRIAGGAILATILAFVCALCVGLVQVVGVLVGREADRSVLAPLAMIVAMPGALFCVQLLGVAARCRLLHW